MMQGQQFFYLLCFITSVSCLEYREPECPVQQIVYSGSFDDSHPYCNTLVNQTFLRRHDENWAQHFAKECEKVFMEPAIERWPFYSNPVQTGMIDYDKLMEYQTLTILDGPYDIINGIYCKLEMRKDTDVRFTIHDPVTHKMIANCSYYYDFRMRKYYTHQFDDKNCLLGNYFGIIGKINAKWTQFCLKLKFDNKVFHKNYFTYDSPIEFELFNCLDHKRSTKMRALCRHKVLEHCRNLRQEIGCESCDEGWKGRICTIRKSDPCKLYPCGSYGICTPLGGEKYSCTCEPNRTGKDCEKKTDACGSRPCQHNGVCIPKGELVYTCICKPGYQGYNCENDVNECMEEICKNGGVCQNNFGSYFCTCQPGFTGLNCEKKVTLAQYCPSEAGAYGGHKLDRNVCISRAIMTFTKHHAENWAVHFAKECKKEYGTADVYAWLPTDPLASASTVMDASNLRFRQIQLDHPKLLNGLYFKISHTESGVIKAEATVSTQATSVATCIIKQDIMGRWIVSVEKGDNSFCEFGDDLLEQFNFVRRDWEYLCLYLSNMNNLTISENSQWVKGAIHIFECVNGGANLKLAALCIHQPLKNCIDFQNNVGCKSCRNGMTGKFCTIDSTDSCSSNPCGSYGTCKHINAESYECLCNPSSFGRNCQYSKPPCDSNPCYNKGTCRNVDRTYKCECVTGFTGPQCNQDVNECVQEMCRNGGTCTNTIGGYVCRCSDGFVGNNCEINKDDCINNPCSNGGTCVDLINDFRCLCRPGYTGKTCNTDLNECDSNPCKNDGTCENRENSYFCRCKPGFTGIQCNGATVFCDTYTCLNGGTCKIVNGNVNCICPKTYTGSRCEIGRILCAEGICGRGKCIQQEIDFKCDCEKTGYEGNRCQIDIDECLPKPCGSYGRCINEIGHFRCVCMSGFTGALCKNELNPCTYENPCRNGGSCSWNNKKVKCICPTELTGQYCTELSSIKSKKGITEKKKLIETWFVVVPIILMILMVVIFAIIYACRRKRHAKRKNISHTKYNSSHTGTKGQRHRRCVKGRNSQWRSKFKRPLTKTKISSESRHTYLVPYVTCLNLPLRKNHFPTKR